MVVGWLWGVCEVSVRCLWEVWGVCGCEVFVRDIVIRDQTNPIPWYQVVYVFWQYLRAFVVVCGCGFCGVSPVSP